MSKPIDTSIADAALKAVSKAEFGFSGGSAQITGCSASHKDHGFLKDLFGNAHESAVALAPVAGKAAGAMLLGAATSNALLGALGVGAVVMNEFTRGGSKGRG